MKRKFKLFKATIVIVLTLVMLSAYSQNTAGQESSANVITTAVPFLMIGPDAYAGGMGNTGVATDPTVSSMHWNAAKYAFIDGDFGIGSSYSPWLRKLVRDMYLAYLTAYKRLDENQVFAFSLRYFNLGSFTYLDEQGNEGWSSNPNEWAFDAAYARKFSEYLSGAITFRGIYSNLSGGQFVGGVETNPGFSVAADVSLYGKKDVRFRYTEAIWSYGVVISNVGSKMGYTENSDYFLPTNLRFGTALKILIDDFNSLAFAMDFNKLLVPTPPEYDSEGNILRGKDPNTSVVGGIFQSFGDAPGGFSEELKEFQISLGAEYWYDDQFALRIGYFYESEEKGNRNFFTVGAGLKYQSFGIDFSYLISTVQQHPLENTMRFSLYYNLGQRRRR
jgi:hypothetical protein